MNSNRKTNADQTDPRQQARARRAAAAAAAAGYTTYQGGDFRNGGPAHRAYESQSERVARDVRAHDAGRTQRPAQAVEDREFRIPRGERTVQASAETREFLEVREERARQDARSSRNGHGSSRTSRDGGNDGGHRNGLPKPVIVILAIALLVSCFCFSKCANLTPEEATGGAFYDQSASEIQEAVDHEVEDGYFNMSINTSVPVFEDNSAALGIKNIESNSYDCIVTVTLDDGTEVFKSGGLAPGTEIDMVTLTQTLEPGDYEATAVFDIYEQDEAHTVAGQTASKLTLHVL